MPTETDIKITLYSNGITINDHNFMDYKNPKAIEILEEIKKGFH